MNNATHSSHESLTAYDKAGMDWWNRSTEFARAYWLKRAASAVPADAWASYLAQSPPPYDMCRLWSGIQVCGIDISIGLLPGMDGALGVRVVAHSSLTGFADTCSLGSDSFSRLRFSPADIRVTADSLECFATDCAAPLVREGFRATIEPSMATTLHAWLPRLAEAAALAAAIGRVAEQALGDAPHSHYLDDFVSGLAALVVLDGLTAVDATDERLNAHWAGKEEKLVEVMRANKIQGLLEAAERASGDIAERSQGTATC